MTQLLLPIIYLAFISLGLPDSLLGSAWPTMYPQLGVPFSYAGILSMIISLGTIVSSLNSDRLTRALGTGKVTALSVGMTAAALFGFSVSGQFWMLWLWAVPYGLGAGSVDAALNNYVALHYQSRHMSWLHCMWGVGTTIGPVVMGTALSGGLSWNSGYRYIALFQIALTVVLFCSLPLWHKRPDAAPDGTVPKALTLPQVFALPGAKEVMLCFFCYCALETTAGLWASSYLSLVRQVPAQTAASFASLFYIGITVGRGVCGFLTLKLSDDQMIRLGFAVLGVGIAALLPGAQVFALAGLVLVGLGCAPIYPSVIGALRRTEFSGRHRYPNEQRLCGQSCHAAAVRSACQQHHPGAIPLLSAGISGADGADAPAAGTQIQLLSFYPFSKPPFSFFVYSNTRKARAVWSSTGLSGFYGLPGDRKMWRMASPYACSTLPAYFSASRQVSFQVVQAWMPPS